MLNPKHDKTGDGFNISPDVLEHDLAILKLSQLPDVATLNEWELYDRYTKLLEEFHAVVEDKIRYDSSFNK